jgi:hypothetical protein
MYPDFEELLEELNSAKAEYLIGGAHAVAFHARPRATKDLDLYIAPGPRNAKRVVKAITRFFGGAAPKRSRNRARPVERKGRLPRSR